MDSELITRVLQNPVVLQTIFANLKCEDCKIIRQVCKSWASQGSTHLGRKSFLNVRKLFPNCCQIAPVPPCINRKLSIYINIDFACTERIAHNIAKTNRAARINFRRFISKTHQHIETLQLKVTSKFAKALIHVLEKYSFPKVRTVSITGIDFARDYPVSCAELRIRTSIKTLELTLRDKFHGYKTMRAYYNLFQNLIDSSPELEVLKITENFIPDLKNCRKLKILEYSGFPYLSYSHFSGVGEEDTTFRMENVNQMLAQVKEFLEVLVLGCRQNWEEDKRWAYGQNMHSKATNLIFPVMKSLKRLNLNGVDIYWGGNQLVDDMKFPTLKFLSLKNAYCEGAILNLFQSINSTFSGHVGIQVVEICPDNVTYTEQSYSPLVSRIFPNARFSMIKQLVKSDNSINIVQSLEPELYEGLPL